MADTTSKRPVDSSAAPTRTSSPASPAAAEDTDLSPAEVGGAVSEPDETAGDEVVADLEADLDVDEVQVVVDLPEAQHEAPEDEKAVAIDDIPVDPGEVVAPSTRSVTVVTAVAPVSGPTPVEIPATVVATPITGPTPLAANSTGPQPAFSTSRRDRLRGEISDQPEPATMLTADRILDGRYQKKNEPTGWWRRAVWYLTLKNVNLGDSPAERHRKELDHRIRKTFDGTTRFVPILTRKGGVGKTTVTTLLGMALADVRDDRIIAIDANPDRGTLLERVPRYTRFTVRDVVDRAPGIGSYTDFSAYVSRDETRLDVLASDTDPNLSEAFNENDYNVVADLVSKYYSIALTDCGTGIVHSVMRATLRRADSIVIVSGGSVDEARLASETLTWLDANGYADLVRNAIVAINTATHGTNLVKLDEIESHFRSRVRDIVRIPYDPVLAAGSVVPYQHLRAITKEAARQLAALVVEGLPATREKAVPAAVDALAEAPVEA